MRSTNPIALFALCLVLVGGPASYLHFVLLPEWRSTRASMGRLDKRLGRIEDSVALMHFSRDPGGQPVEAVLKHLRYWTQRADELGSSMAERPVLDEKLGRAKKALRSLGEPAFDRVEQEFFLAATNAKARRFRRHLLEVMADLDPARAGKMCLDQLQTTGSDPEVRMKAADLAVDLEPDRAGPVLRSILLSEGYRGQRHVLQVKGTQNQLHPGLKWRSFPGFFNLVGTYVRSRDPQKVDVLLQMLGHAMTDGSHDIATLQEVLKGLEAKKDKRAIPVLEKLFSDPGQPVYANPRLRSRTIYVVAAILGRDACSWLSNMLAKERNSYVAGTLRAVLKSHCG